MKRGIAVLGCCLFGGIAAPVSADDTLSIVAYKTPSVPGIILPPDQLERMESGDLPDPQRIAADDLPKTPVPVVAEKGVMLVIEHDGTNILLMSASVKTTRKRTGGNFICEDIPIADSKDREEQGVMSAGEVSCQK